MSRSDDDRSTNELTDTRLNELEREMLRKDSLEMAAIRRLLHGLSDSPTDTDPVAKVDAIVDRIDSLETEVHHLRAQLRSQRTRTGTKKERAKRLARNEVLRQIDNGRNPIGEGGAVDIPTIITMGRGLGIELTHKTVGDAFQSLTTEWNAFELRAGSGTKEGSNKRLVATNDKIPEALWEVYEADTNGKATGEGTVAESSNHTNEGR